MSRITGRIWNFMRKSLSIPSKEDHFIGRDHLGNAYYEKLAGQLMFRSQQTLHSFQPFVTCNANIGNNGPCNHDLLPYRPYVRVRD